MKHMMTIGTSPQFPLHVVRQCNCGRWGCHTRRDSEVQIKFTFTRRPEFYTAECAAEAVHDDEAHCIEWVWLNPATERRLAQARTAESVMVTLFAEAV